MVVKPEVADYFDEIRQQVCSACVERPAGGPPCEPLGKKCGVELHLPELIGSIHEVYSSNSIAPYQDHNRQHICESCVFHHSSFCPCPMDYLVVLITQAVETVDQRRKEGTSDLVDVRNSDGQSDMEMLRRAYQEATGAWVGCDWPTKFGTAQLDLNGCTSRQAKLMADQATNAQQAEDWSKASAWLAEIEKHARNAEAQAAAAVAAAEQGDLPKASMHAERAWASEFATGRTLWHSSPFAWQKLQQVIRQQREAKCVSK